MRNTAITYLTICQFSVFVSSDGQMTVSISRSRISCRLVFIPKFVDTFLHAHISVSQIQKVLASYLEKYFDSVSKCII